LLVKFLFGQSGIAAPETAPDMCAFSFAAFAHGDLLDGIRKIIRVVMTIDVSVAWHFFPNKEGSPRREDQSRKI
jgi:hypothetical protein